MSPRGPRDVDDAHVLKDGRPAARLRRRGNSTVFAYDPTYDGPPLGHSLPLSEERVTPGRSLPAFFTNLLPEGRRLAALRSQVKTAADDDLSLLLSVRDLIGDVEVEAAGSDRVREAAAPLVALDALGSVDLMDLLSQVGFADRVGIPGVQDKLSTGMITLPLRTAAGAGILKVSPAGYPFAVENEAYFLALARRLGLPVAEASIVRDATGRTALLVSRFDRPVVDGVTQRRAVEDGNQLLDLYPADKYRVSAEVLAEAVAGVCAARPVALRAVVLQVCFAWLTGNGDLHAKNISALQGTTGEWRVAPIYDVPSTLPYGDHTLALTVGGRDAGLTRRHLIQFGVDVGLPQRAAERALDVALEATGPLLGDVADGALPFNANLRRDLVRQLGRRRRDAEGA
ncbi:MAG: HipA domain-containing protein [Propionibacteriaceae bacterium]|nr:HipA domain-containing protein [Propionibacteriaceae bacterium]